jgi:hypothetical protein
MARHGAREDEIRTIALDDGTSIGKESRLWDVLRKRTQYFHDGSGQGVTVEMNQDHVPTLAKES